MCRQHHTGCIGVAPVLYAQVNVSSQNLARYVTLVRHTNAVSVTLPLITKLDENITRVAREKIRVLSQNICEFKMANKTKNVALMTEKAYYL